jgi:hypothetical protein
MIPALGLRQEDCEFKASLGYIDSARDIAKILEKIIKV